MSDTGTDWNALLNAAADGAKAGAAGGATIGSIFPGVGTVVGGAAGGVIGGIVGVARSLTGQPHGDDEAPALAQAAQAITGVADQAQQVAALAADPVKAEEFRVQALAVRARAEQARMAHVVALVQAANADRAGARAADAARTGPLRYASLGITLIIFGLYGGVLAASMLGYATPQPDDMATLRNLALAAAFFWLGSNFSSARKTDILAAERERR